MVEGARLESVYSSNVIAGSNPVLSAKIKITSACVCYFCIDRCVRDSNGMSAVDIPGTLRD